MRKRTFEKGQNFNKGSNTEGPHRQGEKGGKGGKIVKTNEDMPAGTMRSGKEGLGAGTPFGGESGGKHTGGTERGSKNNPSGKGAGNR